MVGAGPQWSEPFKGDPGSFGADLDFMFWPTLDRKYGWFVEPSYSYSFIGSHEQSLGVSVGLLIPIYANRDSAKNQKGSALKTHHGFERMRLRGLSGARDEFHLAAIYKI